jgi:hypothetical protein
VSRLGQEISRKGASEVALLLYWFGHSGRPDRPISSSKAPIPAVVSVELAKVAVEYEDEHGNGGVRQTRAVHFWSQECCSRHSWATCRQTDAPVRLSSRSRFSWDGVYGAALSSKAIQPSPRYSLPRASGLTG